MKAKNRLVCALLSVVLLLSACGPAASGDDEKDTGKDTAKDTSVSDTIADDTSADDTSTEDTSAAPDDTTAALYTDNLPDADFDGRALRMFGDNRSAALIVDQEALNIELNKDAVNEKVSAALYKSRNEVEERFHCTIRYDQYDENEVDALFRNLVNTGDNSYSVCMARDTIMTAFITVGLTYNLSNIAQFDFSQPWYAKTTETMSFGDMRFLGSSFLSYQLLQSCRVIVFNRDMWTSLNLELPYDKVFAGEWYLDDFILAVKTARNDLNGDNVFDETDQWGFSTASSELYTFQKCLGINFIAKDENNYPQFTTDCLEKATVYLEKMSAIYDQEYAPGKTFNTIFGQEWVADGHALTCYTTMGRAITDVVPSDIEFGYLPIPKLDENQEDYIFCTTDTFWAIPTSAIKGEEDRTFLGTVLEAYQCSNYNYVRPAYFETAMKYQAANYEEDSRILNMIPERLILDLGYSYNFDSGTVNIVRSTSTDKLASTLAKADKAIPKKIEKIIEKLANIAAMQAAG